MSSVNAPYNAYHRPQPGPEDPELTHVGRGTPCGEFLRRFWQPVALTSEVKDVPLRLRILGEDLVLFRDLSGNYGLLELHCRHRRASLEFGKITETGLRCAYHGWQFDIDGTILDTPGEPPTSVLKKRICQGAYPVHEFAGVIFAYMGPPDRKPKFPIFDLYRKPGTVLVPKKIHSPCNWLQICENEMDPMHVPFLHTRLYGVQFSVVKGEIPTLEFIETPAGMMYITSRRWKDNKVYIRSNDMIFPNMARVSGNEDAEGDEETVFDRRGGTTKWVVPIDDTNSWTIGWSDHEELVGEPRLNSYLDRMHRSGEHAVGPGDVGQTGDIPYEERQRQPGDWDVWVSQGRITIHSEENLASSDRGVALFRKLLRDGIRRLAAGEEPSQPGAGQDPIRTYAHNSVLYLEEEADPQEDARKRAAFARDLTDRILRGEVDSYVDRVSVVSVDGE